MGEAQIIPHLQCFCPLSPFLQVGSISESAGSIQGEAVLTPSFQRFRVTALRRNREIPHRSQILQSRGQPSRGQKTFLSLGHVDRRFQPFLANDSETRFRLVFYMRTMICNAFFCKIHPVLCKVRVQYRHSHAQIMKLVHSVITI